MIGEICISYLFIYLFISDEHFSEPLVSGSKSDVNEMCEFNHYSVRFIPDIF